MIVDLPSLLSRANSSHPPGGCCPAFHVQYLVKVESCIATKYRGVDADEMPIGWMWPLAQRPEVRAANQRRGPVCTLSRNVESQMCSLASEQDSSLAANSGLRRFPASNRPYFVWGNLAQRNMRTRSARPDRMHQRPRIFELLSTLQADLVRPFFDRENATALVMMASESKLNNPKQRFHKSLARCRRTQLPLSSGQLGERARGETVSKLTVGKQSALQ